MTNWISVLDRLPGEGQRVLTVDMDFQGFYDTMETAEFYGQCFCFPENIRTEAKGKLCPTHWMPLPSPPVDKKRNCNKCGKEYRYRRGTSKWCSDVCKVAAHRENNDLQQT